MQVSEDKGVVRFENMTIISFFTDLFSDLFQEIIEVMVTHTHTFLQSRSLVKKTNRQYVTQNTKEGKAERHTMSSKKNETNDLD